MRYHRFSFAMATLCTLILNTGAVSSQAQTIRTDAVAHKLSIVIRVPPQVLTFEQVARLIERQTGVPIRPAEYLLPHRILLKADRLSAAALLNTLSEIYGWQWRETREGAISIDRPTVRTPTALAGVADAVRQVLSPQLLRYSGVVTAPAPSATAAKSHPSPTPPPYSYEPRHLAAPRFPQGEHAGDPRSQYIWPTIPARLLFGHDIPFADYDQTDRDRILECLLGRAFSLSYQQLQNVASNTGPLFLQDLPALRVNYNYRRDGVLQGILLGRSWTEGPNGAQHYSGIGSGF